MIRRVIAILALASSTAVILFWLSHLPAASVSQDSTPDAPATYALPSPSYWPLSPYPMGSVRPQPTTTVEPCPPVNYVPPGGWLYSPAPPPPSVPTTAPDGTPACTVPGGVPPDPHTGPVLASPTP